MRALVLKKALAAASAQDASVRFQLETAFAASHSGRPARPPGKRGAIVSPGVAMARPRPSAVSVMAQRSAKITDAAGSALLTESASAS